MKWIIVPSISSRRTSVGRRVFRTVTRHFDILHSCGYIQPADIYNPNRPSVFDSSLHFGWDSNAPRINRFEVVVVCWLHGGFKGFFGLFTSKTEKKQIQFDDFRISFNFGVRKKPNTWLGFPALQLIAHWHIDLIQWPFHVFRRGHIPIRWIHRFHGCFPIFAWCCEFIYIYIYI